MNTNDSTVDLHDDDEIDFSTLDRGDNLTDDTEKDDGPARDDKGRFTAKSDAKTEESEEESEEEETKEEPQAKADESEEEEGEEEEEEGKKDDKNLGIRLNKMREQRDRERAEREALAARLAEIEKQLAKKDEPEAKDDPFARIDSQLDSLYEQVEELRADGNTKEAAKVQRQIDALKEERVEIKARQIATQTSTVQQENARYDAMLDVIEANVDAINPKSDDFDPAMVKELDTLVTAYEKTGLRPTAALHKATKLLFGFDLANPKKAEPAPKTEAKKPEAKKPDAAKAVETQKKQPPSLNDRGINNDSTKIRVETLSDEEYEKLPESKKRELRGDFAI